MARVREGYLEGWAETQLFYRAVEAEGTALGTVLVVHGYAEHCGRYESFMNDLSAAGWNAFSFDFRGHGNSEGLKGYISRFRHLIYDLEAVVKHVKEQEDPARFALYAHSVGAAVAFLYAADHQDDFDAAVLSSMYFKSTVRDSPFLIAAGRVIEFFLPTLPLGPFAAENLSRDAEVVATYRKDPLVYNGLIRVRTGLELIYNYKSALASAPAFTKPVLMLHGSADRISDPATTREIYNRVGSSKKRLIEYDDLYHELLNEPEKAQVTQDIIGWLAGIGAAG